MTSNDLKHTTHDSKFCAPSRNTSQNLPLKPQDSNLCAQASEPIVDPQGSNLCDPETQKPYNLRLQATGFEPMPLGKYTPSSEH